MRSALTQIISGRRGLGRRPVQHGVGLLRRLGYTRDALIRHLESQFQPGMTWANYGRRGWEVDHRIPVSAFDHTDREQFRVCWSLDNLRPMWAAANRAKGARVA